MDIPSAHPLPNGLVIIFEGVDGTGKTTQLDLTRQALTAAGWPVLSTRNLGGTPIGEALREVMLSQFERPPLTDFYISLAIQEALLDVIDEARRAGKIILMDRGPLSLAAYQVFAGGIGEDAGWRHVRGGMDRIRPECVVLYDMDAAAAIERGRQRPGHADYFESKPLAYFKKVAEGYRAAAVRFPSVTVIDAAQPVADIHEKTMAIITPLLAARS